MDYRQVVAFHEILNEAFPVGLPVLFRDMHKAEALGLVGGQQPVEVRVIKRRRVGVQIDVNKSVPQMYIMPVQAAGLGVKPGVFHPRGP